MSNIIDQSSLAEKVYDLLKVQILSGELKGGMVIPEEQLAQQFGVSRTPIREAIKRLAEYGLVILKPRSHALVYQVDDKEAHDIASVRIALESLAITLLTPAMVEKNIHNLSKLAAECQYNLGISNRADLYVSDSLFHLELVKCTENSALYTLYERLDSQCQLLRIAQNLPFERLSEIVNHHTLMLQYLKNEDVGACLDLIIKHVNNEM
ncbi:MAG: GntR family transcriptional regulator [Sphaerochaeta sp.]|nr:GntR family transcriptional regulator [Sphaerochaeta sp.]